MIVISGNSAFAWWRTPPIIRDTALPADALKNIPSRAQELKALLLRPSGQNEGAVTEPLRSRILSDLKGIPLPIEVCTDEIKRHKPTPLYTVRHASVETLKPHLVDLGGGLYVANPELAIVQMMNRISDIEALHMLYEANGIYAIFKPTPLASITANLIERELGTACWEAASKSGINAYWNESGSRCPMPSYEDDTAGWTPCLSRTGAMTTLWKRPSLTTRERYELETTRMKHLSGLRRARKLAPLIVEGAGSPLETNMVMIICLPPELGGEGWSIPYLNRRIALSPGARLLSGSSFCIGDQVWPDSKLVLEENGKEYHADRDGFAEHSGRRAALESMGYIVQEITYAQMSHYEQLEAILLSIATQFGFSLQPRTPAFIRKRKELLALLFPRTMERTCSTIRSTQRYP